MSEQKRTKADVQAELEAAGVPHNKKAKLEELEALLADCKANGIPHTLTDEDMAANTDLAAKGLKAGDEVRIPFPSAAPADAGAGAQDAAAAAAASEQGAPPEGTGQAPTQEAPAAAQEAPKADVQAEPEGEVEVELVSSMKRDGAMLEPGSKVTLSAKEAKELKAAGVVK